MNPVLTRLNSLPVEQVRDELLKCCGSRRWADALLKLRPFPDEAALFEGAREAWAQTEEADWLEAFSHHPRIGEKRAAAPQSEAARQWSAQEQSGTQGAEKDVMDALARGNVLYEQRFGFVYLVCATGKSASEMLGILERRLKNTREQELRTAAAEQGKITQIRLEKWLKS